ncbi:MAG: hypothetical protein GXZ01_12440 [Clostridiaceae bacterium]|nr:hypothetical protein [Clostridiaceae bacterium]
MDRNLFVLQKETERLTEGYAITRYDMIEQKIKEIENKLDKLEYMAKKQKHKG